MNAKGYIVSTLVLVFLGWLVFWPDDRPKDEVRDGQEPESSIDTRRMPKEPEPLPPVERYGVASAPAPPANETPHGVVRDYYYGEPWSRQRAYPPVHAAPEPPTRYTYRPLTERERKRLETERPVFYPPYEGGAPPSGTTQARRGHPDTSYRATHQNSIEQRFEAQYSFRPYERSPSAADPWRGGFPQRPDRRNDRDSAEPWGSPPPDPQWGSTPPDYWTPPTERMYPSLDRPWGRRLSAR